MIIAIIPAKGKSKRLPNKNMKLLLGEPMLYYSIDYCKKSHLISGIYVTTDDENIIQYSKKQGVNVIERSEELGGETDVIDVYKHAFAQINDPNIETIVGVQPDHPDRKISLDKSVDYFKSKNLDLLYSIDSKNKKMVHIT